MNLSGKTALQELHWSVQEYDDADYYRLREILNAKEPNDREVDPRELVRASHQIKL